MNAENCAVCGRPLIAGNIVLFLDYVNIETRRGVRRRACRLCSFAYSVGLKSENWKKPKG